MAKYSKEAGEKVEKSTQEMHEGKLKIGRSDKKVTDPKQAIAIGLSEAKEEGAKVPKKSSAEKNSPSKSGTIKTGTHKPGPKKGTPKKK